MLNFTSINFKNILILQSTEHVESAIHKSLIVKFVVGSNVLLKGDMFVSEELEFLSNEVRYTL